MARILYAVHGEGMGHAIRSKVVIKHLLRKKHEVVIVAGGKAFPFLSKIFNNVYNIDCFNIVYKKNRATNIDTSVNYLRKLPVTVTRNFRSLLKIIVNFEPHLLITDFEPFSNFISRLLRIPVIALDNITMIRKGKFKIPRSEILSYLTARLITNLFNQINANRYIITTFFYPKIKRMRNTVFVPPVLRQRIIRTKPAKGRHILVYQTSITNKALLDELKGVDEKFLIYGFDEEKKDQNLIFRKFSEKDFVKDLASCKALIVNGGFTVISEAIYLHKPTFSVPVRNQFEQILNAIYVEKLGYGEYHKKATADVIRKFLKNTGKYRKNLAGYHQEGNKLLFEEVDKTIKELMNKKSYLHNIKFINKRLFEFLNRLEVFNR